MTNLHNITNKALEQWIEVTGVDPAEDRNQWSWGEYQVQQINDYIREAQDLDATGLTAFMVVRAVARDYIEEHTFTALELIDEDDSVLQRISALRKLARLLENPEALEVVSQFQEQLRKAADHYGVREQVEETIQDMSALSHIRRDALICTTLLDRHTFAKGAKAEHKLSYNPNLIKLWNMNSLVRMAEIQPVNGISIVLVRDPIAAYSFFCFLVRDGENITIWTDHDKQTHPMAKAKARSRGQARQLANRMARLRFPYQLLDVTFVDEGKHVHTTVGRELVRTNIQAVPVGQIKDLEPDQILWILLALDVLTKAEHSPSLSVTGEAMTLQLAPGQTRVLPETLVPTQVLGHDEVSSENLDRQLGEREHQADRSSGANDWMEARYKDQVDPRLYNLTDIARPVGHQPRHLEVEDESDTREMVLLGGERVEALSLLPKARGLRYAGAAAGHEAIHGPHLIGLDPVAFGSPKEMEEDRLWVARWNQAQALALAAQAEFDARVADVQAWFDARVRANAEVILDRIMQGSWDVTTPRIQTDWKGEESPLIDRLVRWYRQPSDTCPMSYSDHWASKKDAQCLLYRRDAQPTKQSRHGCYVTGLGANCWVILLPTTPEGIAALAGVEVKDLPELLEHWDPKGHYRGNSILRRTDPLDSEVGNPWNALSFQVVIGLSKREWNRRAKACGATATIPWQTKRKDGGWE